MESGSTASLAASGSISTIWACDDQDKAVELLTSRRQNSTSKHPSHAPPPLTLYNFVSGEFTGHGPDGTADTADRSQWLTSYEPKTGLPLARIPRTSADAASTAIAAASASFPAWSRTSRTERARLLHRVADLIRTHAELFAVWESVDQGKTLDRARAEMSRAATNFSYFANFIMHEQHKTQLVDPPPGVETPPVMAYEHRSPLGPFTVISPWNMPLYLLTWKIAPALAFGCTVVAKPSEVTSVTAFLLAELLRQVEFPPGVVNIVLGDGATTGSALVSSPLIRGVSFTGGTATGRQIRRDTVDDLGKHISLELGGKNPTIVFDDVADLDQAVTTAASAAFTNQGEICLCGSRIYVQQGIYDRFLAAFKQHVDSRFLPGKELGAIVSREHYAKVRSYISLAREEKATFQLGFVPPDVPEGGYWITPVILTDVQRTSKIMQEEIFGPVVTVTPFETEADAIDLANGNPNGLAAVLLTRDGARMRRVGEQLDAGLVWVNTWLVRALDLPFGGMKDSGVGREGGDYSRDVFTEVRVVHVPAA